MAQSEEQEWNVERILFGPYEDELKRKVYLCEVRRPDFFREDEAEVEEWKEVEERDIHMCIIRGFHRGSTKVPLLPRPPKRQRDSAGAQASRGVGTYTSHDRIIQGLKYFAPSGRATDFYEQNCHREGAYCDVESPNPRCALVAWDEVLQPGSCLELREGGYLFIHKIRFQATDGEVEEDSIALHGQKMKTVSMFLKCDGSDAERERGESAVVADTSPSTVRLSDAEALVPAVPAAFWEDGDVFDGKIQWLGHMAGNGVQRDGSLHVIPLSQSALARYGWASLSFPSQNDYFCTVHSTFLKKFDAWLRARVTTNSCVATETLLWFSDVPPAWLYWALGRAWFVKHPHKARYLPDLRLHEFVGSSADFERVFRRDVGQRIAYSDEIAASIGEAPDHPAVTFRFTMKRPGKLMVLFGGVRKHRHNRVAWDTAKNACLVRDTFRQCPCCYVDAEDASDEEDLLDP